MKNFKVKKIFRAKNLDNGTVRMVDRIMSTISKSGVNEDEINNILETFSPKKDSSAFSFSMQETLFTLFKKENKILILRVYSKNNSAGKPTNQPHKRISLSYPGEVSFLLKSMRNIAKNNMFPEPCNYFFENIDVKKVIESKGKSPFVWIVSENITFLTLADEAGWTTEVSENIKYLDKNKVNEVHYFMYSGKKLCPIFWSKLELIMFNAITKKIRQGA